MARISGTVFMARISGTAFMARISVTVFMNNHIDSSKIMEILLMYQTSHSVV